MSKDKTVINIPETKQLLSELFQNGIALDLIDISGERDKNSLSSGERYVYDVADEAFSNVDIDELFNRAEELGIPEKYPEFYDFLCELQLEHDDNKKVRDRDSEEIIDEAEELEEVTEEVENNISAKDKALINIVGGEHTGKNRDSEVYRKQDEYRQNLTDEYNKMIEDAANRSNNNGYIVDSYGSTNQHEISEKKPFQDNEHLQNIKLEHGNKEKTDSYSGTSQQLFSNSVENPKLQNNHIGKKKNKADYVRITENDMIVRQDATSIEAGKKKAEEVLLENGYNKNNVNSHKNEAISHRNSSPISHEDSSHRNELPNENTKTTDVRNEKSYLSDSYAQARQEQVVENKTSSVSIMTEPQNPSNPEHPSNTERREVESPVVTERDENVEGRDNYSNREVQSSYERVGQEQVTDNRDFYSSTSPELHKVSEPEQSDNVVGSEHRNQEATGSNRNVVYGAGRDKNVGGRDNYSNREVQSSYERVGQEQVAENRTPSTFTRSEPQKASKPEQPDNVVGSEHRNPEATGSNRNVISGSGRDENVGGRDNYSNREVQSSYERVGQEQVTENRTPSAFTRPEPQKASKPEQPDNVVGSEHRNPEDTGSNRNVVSGAGRDENVRGRDNYSNREVQSSYERVEQEQVAENRTPSAFTRPEPQKASKPEQPDNVVGSEHRNQEATGSNRNIVSGAGRDKNVGGRDNYSNREVQSSYERVEQEQVAENRTPSAFTRPEPQKASRPEQPDNVVGSEHRNQEDTVGGRDNYSNREVQSSYERVGQEQVAENRTPSAFTSPEPQKASKPEQPDNVVGSEHRNPEATGSNRNVVSGAGRDENVGGRDNYSNREVQSSYERVGQEQVAENRTPSAFTRPEPQKASKPEQPDNVIGSEHRNPEATGSNRNVVSGAGRDENVGGRDNYSNREVQSSYERVGQEQVAENRTPSAFTRPEPQKASKQKSSDNTIIGMTTKASDNAGIAAKSVISGRRGNIDKNNNEKMNPISASAAFASAAVAKSASAAEFEDIVSPERIENWSSALNSGKTVLDSYERVGNLQQKNANTANIGSYGRRSGNIVTIPVDGRTKQFTMRADGTIVIGNTVMPVYGMDGGNNNVFVGWKDTVVKNGRAVTPDGQKFKVLTDSDKKNVLLDKKFNGVDIEISDGTFFDLSPEFGTSASSKTKLNTESGYTKSDFSSNRTKSGFSTSSPFENTETQVENNFSTKDGVWHTKVDDSWRRRFNGDLASVFKEHELTHTIQRQGLMMKLAFRQEELQALKDTLSLSKNDIDIIADNYNSILKVRAYNHDFRKMNVLLESRYLSRTDKELLSTIRCKLRTNGLDDDVDKFKELLKCGKLTEKRAELAKEYIALYEKTRKNIVTKSLASIGPDAARNMHIEYGFFETAIPVLLAERGLPTNVRELKQLAKSNTLSKKDQMLVENALLVRCKIRRLNMLESAIVGTVKNGWNATKTNYRKAKSLLSKYMGDDYTTRGLLMATSVLIEAPVKAYMIARKTRNFARNSSRLIRSTANATRSIGRMTVRAGKTTVRTAQLVKKNGIKKNAERAVRRIKSRFTLKRIRTGVKKIAKETTQSIIKTVLHIMKILVTALISALGPMVFGLVCVLILIFSIFSFLKSSGDDIYYDAGDEETEAVIQELVGVSTLCHASFRSALSSSFGGIGGVYGSGTFNEFNAPQMKKGDSSPVKGLYDVTAGTWSNWEFGYPYPQMAAGTNQRKLQDLFTNGTLKVTNNGGMMFVENKLYCAAFTSYWGNVGDVLRIEFEGSKAIGNEPATNTLFVIITDIKAYKHTGYPEQPEGLYGHHLGNHRDFAEFFWYGGAEHPNLNSSEFGMPLQATNIGSILDGTCDLSMIGAGMSLSSRPNADILYRQEIDQDVYREILNRDKNIYYTFPEEQELPDGITATPSPTPKIGLDGKPIPNKGTVYGFYNNTQELVAMTLAMFDFDINDTTSAKRTELVSDSGSMTDKGYSQDWANKINDDTWKLVAFLDDNGIDMTRYKEGGYDDLKYSAFVGLFNASHIVTGTPVLQYHEGPDGTINPEYNEDGRIIGQNNTDGMSYRVPVMITVTHEFVKSDGTIDVISYETQATDENGDFVFETKYKPCPGHRKNSGAVITLHFDSLLDMPGWYDKNIYSVDDFDKENPNYESKNENDLDYKQKSRILKPKYQYIKKPDFYMSLPDTCSEESSISSNLSGGFSPGTMTESQAEVANKCYQYMITEMKTTPEQAVGMLVNILRESEFDYTAVESGSGKGYGLCQWTGERRTSLINWCNSHPESGAYNTLSGQLAFLKAEFDGYGGVWTGNGMPGFRACSTEREAMEYFIRYFERPAAEYMTQRIAEMDGDIATVKKYLITNTTKNIGGTTDDKTKK